MELELILNLHGRRKSLPITKTVLKRRAEDFPGSSVIKNPPANAGEEGSSPGPGRSHMLWSN